MLAVRTTSLLLALSALVIVVCTPALLAGQDSATGSLRGTVLDPAGARVTQASIAVVNAGTGARYSAISDSEGHFAMELLPPGDYSARVEAQGMSPQVTPQLHVDVLAGEYPAAQIGNSSYAKLDIKPQPTQPTRIAREHHALLGSEQRLPRSGQSRKLRLDQQ
jgi:hypothetical protein